jgi:N-acetylglutamate synthase-like GNAT family acetyltransferase
MIRVIEKKAEALSNVLENSDLKKLNVKLYKDGYRYFVVEKKGVVEGIAIIEPIAKSTFPWKGAAAEIKCLFVFEPNRKKGLGSKILSHIKAVFSCPVKATILPSTQGFWEKHDFKKVFQRGQYPVMATDAPKELWIQ